MTDENVADDAVVSNANLDDAFDESDEGNEEVEATATKTPTPAPEEKGDDSDPEEDEEDAEPPAAEDDAKGKSVPVAALKSERSKRQAAEAERDELKKRLAPEDTEEQGEPNIDVKLFTERTNMSREMMMDSKPDYEEMENIFTEIANANPHLVSEMVKSPNPAKFAYQKAKEHIEYQQFLKDKDSAEYKDFLKAKASGKIVKPVSETPEDKRKKSVLAVPNINKAASIGSNSTPKENLESLDEMFED